MALGSVPRDVVSPVLKQGLASSAAASKPNSLLPNPAAFHFLTTLPTNPPDQAGPHKARPLPSQEWHRL